MQESIILTLNYWMASHEILIVLMPLLGDIFVFSYPIYLIYLYFSHPWKENWRRRKRFFEKNKQVERILHNKLNALTIFFTTLLGIWANYIVKLFVHESRPFYTLDLAINPNKALILEGLPVDTFPSDHATVGMAVAISTLLLWYQHKNKSMQTMWWIFLGFTCIMNFSRITIGVHRPADILWGMGVGLMVATLMVTSPVQQRLQHHLYIPLIWWQEYFFDWIRRMSSMWEREK